MERGAPALLLAMTEDQLAAAIPLPGRTAGLSVAVQAQHRTGWVFNRHDEIVAAYSTERLVPAPCYTCEVIHQPTAGACRLPLYNFQPSKFSMSTGVYCATVRDTSMRAVVCSVVRRALFAVHGSVMKRTWPCIGLSAAASACHAAAFFLCACIECTVLEESGKGAACSARTMP